MERMTKRRGFFEAFVSCCFSQAQPILVVNRHDENALPRQVESVEMIGLGLEDHVQLSRRTKARRISL